MITQFSVQTKENTQFINITSRVMNIVRESEVSEGLCIVYIPHTTAGVTINESADPDVFRDIKMEISKIVPFSDRYKHMEGNSAAHIKTSLFGISCQIPITNNKLFLGTWQGIFFCEFDGPRNRTACVKIIKDQ